MSASSTRGEVMEPGMKRSQPRFTLRETSAPLATKRVQSEVSTGTNLTTAMGNSGVFPSMVLQMCAIGEESGALDAMLGKVADFYEQEVDEAVDSLSSLMEPMIMVVLGGLIGGIVVAMYLPIFKMGQAI